MARSAAGSSARTGDLGGGVGCLAGIDGKVFVGEASLVRRNGDGWRLELKLVRSVLASRDSTGESNPRAYGDNMLEMAGDGSEMV